ncbi:pyruvate dehydrogenase complex dihydrolipoamide acetyltransferase [Verrucomicrobiaceae bacterium R5-34]|uniref:Acetyltransferase component of pyruvate dehydrogenase complex n=1 Tax=Oceaniferula flava TaxID=2800421 RepID=A0AAE2SDX2_9BACT|nr:pyruvate dehydrogenase complex dihydrolipoamide acetyltransferase [Oceaniferula flavus]MBK1830039.1 pyruvate dehydrogenase complex dihydrolipoamide acetyltransferase [Verrucomicrobiaceae bacterium R5-34]MBK1855114.1 pyruvate dehydrogenase complex dihydrolipoamide acetyltransferase [Oceaniferula flavus]MBM1136420.1 pyruvate dehydrogenase complex dihydrolipoamide acetyltransferase [Oceaniferula flavus]
MPINIEMPKLSDTMTEGTLVRWNKQVGDEIEIGDVIAEVETDKATMEMEAFDEGTLTEIRIQAGDKAPVGAVLGILTEEGEEAGSSAPAQESAPEPAADAPASQESAAASAPAAGQQSAPAASTDDSGKRIKASPLARKIAADKGVDLASLSGSGPAGRIVKADVEAAASGSASKATSPLSAAANALAASAKSQATQSAAPAAAPAPQATAIAPTVAAEDQTIELSSMRRIIADRLLTSKTTIPHFYLHVEADTAPLMTLRKQVNAQAEQTHGNKYSVNDFVLKAVINALQAVPEVNASFNGDSIVQFAKIGISVAVAVDDGLVTPVVKDAASKSMMQISQEVKDLAVRARDKKLKPNEFDGGTITVSNLGAWGIESFDAIINPPQAAILSVGAIVQKPVVKDGAIVPGQRMNIGLSCDHRVVDGAVGAKFLNEVKKLIENPALMLV